MDIVALVGPSSCGKSSSLNIAYSQFLQLGGISTDKQTLGDIRQNDFSDIVLWEGKVIAFFSMGDYSKPLIIAIRAYSVQNVDVLICACNNKLVRPLWEFDNHNTQRVNKIPEPNSDHWGFVNNQIAQTIVNRTREVLRK